MAYFNGKRVLFSPTVNISEAQGVPNIPETTTTWAGLFDLANGVYIVPERTENKISFPDTFIVPENEVKGLIEVQDGKIYFYRAEVFAEKNADNSVFWQVKKLLDEYVNLDEFIDSGATDGIYYSQMAVTIPNDAQGRNLYGLFEYVRDNIDGKGQIISYYWGLEITWNAGATAPRTFTVKNISGIGKQDIMQYTEMPEASQAYENKIVQYVGKTAGSYITGYFYQCRGSSSSYRWYPIVVSRDSTKMDKPDTLSSIVRLVTYSFIDGTGIAEINKDLLTDANAGDSIPTSKAVINLVKAYIESIALKGSKSGGALLIDDLSPLTHEMGVKVSSDTIENLTTVKVRKQGKNLIPFPYRDLTLGTSTYNGVDFTVYEDGSILINGTATKSTTKYLYNNATDLLGLKSGITIAGSKNASDNTQQGNAYFICNYYDSAGKMQTGIQASTFASGKTTITDEWKGLGIYINVPNGKTVNNLLIKPQLEIGATATEYEAYITPTEYIPAADGTVNGITSLYPNTTLTTDTDGVIINCEYNRDINKAFAALEAAISTNNS